MPVVTTAEYVVMGPGLRHGLAFFRPDSDTGFPVFHYSAVTGTVGREGFRPARVSPDAKPRPYHLKAFDTDGHS